MNQESDLSKQIKALRITRVGRLIYTILPYRKRVVMANINQVFGETLDQNQKILLAQAFYSHIVTSLKEIVLMSFMSDTQLKSMVEVRGHERLLDISNQQRGVLVVTCHIGNWELVPIGGILNFTRFQGKFHFIRRMLVNKFVERILFNRYYHAGLNVITKKNALQRVCEVLDQNHVVVFVLDQHAKVENRDGIAVEFFGKLAGTYRSLASIARYTGVPVVPSASYRLPNGKHVLEFYEAIPWQDYADTKEALYRNTLAYNQALERIILAHPEQWMWFHKRWK